MKEQTQQPGVRKWAGDDMIALQAEPLSAIQGFFKEYGNCIIQGCETNAAPGGKFNITPGLLGLSGMDADGVATFKVVPFSGVENVTLPLYFTLTHSVIDRVYGDGKVKPIAYDYRAAVSAVKPAAGVEFLELTNAGGRRFVDAVKITEKLDKVGNGKDVTVTFAQAANRENIVSGEKLTTVLGKIVRWLADLKALAFKDKVSKADMDTALQGELNGKLNLSGGTMTAPLYVNYPASDIKARFAKTASNDAAVIGINNANDLALCFLKISREDVNYHNGVSEYKMWHSGNFNPRRKLSQLDDIKDANDVSEDGAGRTAVFTANIPGGGLGGYLVNYVWDTNAGHQMFFSYTDNDCFVRRKGGGVWYPWRKIAEISDIPVSLPANGGNADTVGGLGANMLARAYIPISFGGTSGDITTEEFIAILNNNGAFNQPFWSSRGTWFFAGNKIISDTGAGRIHLAGASVEVISDASSTKFTARVTTAATTPDAESRRIFIYTKNDTSAVWFKLANSTDIPATLPANGGNADTVGGKRATDFAAVSANGNQNLNNLNGFGMLSNLSDNFATSENNYPIKQAGVLIHGNAVGGSANQLYGTYYSNRWFARGGGSAPGQKTAWKEFAMLDSTGNLTLNTSNASYVTLNRNGESVAYMGLGSTTKKDLLFQLYKSGNFIRIGEDGKNYSNNKEIATIDQIKPLSGGAAPTAGQYVSGITVNDHEITVTKAVLPTTTADISEVTNKKYVTDAEKADWNGKAPANHTHPYAPDNHNHDSVYAVKSHSHNYEPAFSKNTAFNRYFGTTAGTVAQGNHTHAGITTMKAMYEFTISGITLNKDLKKGSDIVTFPIRNSGGNYTINHNLGHDNYVVILGTGKREGGDVIAKVGLIEQAKTYFKVQVSWGDQFRDGGFYATILTF